MGSIYFYLDLKYFEKLFAPKPHQPLVPNAGTETVCFKALLQKKKQHFLHKLHLFLVSKIACTTCEVCQSSIRTLRNHYAQNAERKYKILHIHVRGLLEFWGVQFTGLNLNS